MIIMRVVVLESATSWQHNHITAEEGVNRMR